MGRMIELRRGVWGWVMVALCAAMASCGGEPKHSPEAVAATREAGMQPAATMAANLPTIFLAGDSTGANGDPLHTGWGKMFGQFIDPAKGRFVNGARGGRSSRTFVNEGLWGKLVGNVKPGDYVMIQFGMNDGGAVDQKPWRASLPGVGEETQEVVNGTGAKETVHTFGWYVRKMVEETKKAGGTAIVVSPTVRNIWKEGKVVRGLGHYCEWAKQVAGDERVAYVDLNTIIADRYDAMGEEAVKKLFLVDPVHTGPAGAEINAELMVAGLKALHRQLLDRVFSGAAAGIDPAPQGDVVVGRYSRPGAGATEIVKADFLNEVVPANPGLPSVVLIGDSTVRNGRGDGSIGLWGWGDALGGYMEPATANLVNRALGGTGVRTYINSGEWEKTLALVKKGDVVIMQFGTNDNGPTGPLKGVGEETEERTGRDGKVEVVHTYGWYLRKYVADVRGKGGVPVICTLVPRNVWEGGKIQRPVGSHADWARAVAKEEGVGLVDLYERIATKLDGLGQEKATALYADKRVHTTGAGAELDAECVVGGLKALGDDPVAGYFRETRAETW